MANRSFKAIAPAQGSTFDINGTVFHLKPAVPGQVIIDFLAAADDEDSAAMAKLINDLLEVALDPDDLDRFKVFVNDESNAVSLSLLAEIAGYVAEELSGNDRQPALYGPG